MTDAVKASEIIEAAYDAVWEDDTDNPVMDDILQSSDRNVANARIEDEADLVAGLHFAATHALDLTAGRVLRTIARYRLSKLKAA